MIRGRNKCDEAAGCGRLYDHALDVCPHCGADNAFSDFLPFNPIDWTYDLETYPNIFTASFKHLYTGTRSRFEISDRRNDLHDLYAFLMSLKHGSCRLTGYNNIGFDYPLIHFIIENFNLQPDVNAIYHKSQTLINTPWERRYDNVIKDWKTHIVQLDLMKIHHFDNRSRMTSLKLLEFNMRMDDIRDLPYPPGTILNDEQKDVLISYNDHDVDATELFLIESLEMIEIREQLSKKYGKSFLNHSDKKIGTDIFIAGLESSSPGICYNPDRTPRQTIRNSIVLGDIIFPYINFKEPEFNRVKDWLSTQVITNFDSEYLNIKGIFKDFGATINGFFYKFGSGGLHASVKSSILCSDDEYVIIDVDVGGFYPELGGKNNLFPEHLSNQFCVVNEQLKQERKQYKKGTAENNSIKLARNGAYGDSNSRYSVFYDPQYTMSITINGQLLLCMLAQYLIDIPGLQMIQCNTDGLTVRLPRKHEHVMDSICKWWDDYTCLELEKVKYSRMFIRDVNNYIAEYEDGKLKSKGAYVHQTKQTQGNAWTPADMDWHQDYSALVVPMAAEAALVHGQDIADFIHNHNNIHDFMLRTKIGRADRLEFNDLFNNKTVLQRVTRYYISDSVGAGSLTKISPPAKGYTVGSWKRASGLSDQLYSAVRAELVAMNHSATPADHLDTNGLPWDSRINTKNRSKYKIRSTSINSGYLVVPCNKISEADRSTINYEFYIAETEKLVNPLRGVDLQ